MKEVGKSRIYITIFSFFLFLIWCSPISNDDYEFLSLSFETPQSLISYILHYGNGRFLGNLSSILLIHFPVISCFFRALMISSLIFLLPLILGQNKLYAYFFSFLLFIIIDPTLFGHVYLWSSGFYNYVPPIWMSLVILYIMQLYQKISNKFIKSILCMAVFSLGIASQLYVEHSTITNILLSIFFLFISRKKARNSILPFLLWTIATIIGACVMFSIPILFYVEGNRSEGYRSYNFQNIIALVSSCAKNALRIGNHYSGLNSIPLCIATLSTFSLTIKERGIRSNHTLFITILLCCGFLLLESLVGSNAWYGELAFLHHTLKVIVLISLFLMWIIASMKLPKAKLRHSVWFLIFMTIASLAPLLVVSPVPMRTVFQSYIFLCFAAMLCISEILEQKSCEFLQTITAITSTLCVSVIIMMSSVFIGVKQMVTVREEYILKELENGAAEIAIYSIPYPYFPWDNTGSYKYYFYQEKPGDTLFNRTDYSQWMNDYYPMIQFSDKP